MRKFRNAALAAATATAVAFGGTSVAMAEETQDTKTQSSGSSIGYNQEGDTPLKDLLGKLGGGNVRHEIGKATDAGKPADINNFFTNPEDMPQWARIWHEAFTAVSVLAAIGAVIGLGNYALNQGLLPQIPW
ncbi:hypothetical protein KBP53_07245 [Corynebacterium genitalium ATCC 33030]|uniref:Tat pathway signal sequence domain protein n=1 Tax=Corynebacterium genitalium ATCC 33030 TaxID=585529 RepID=D7WF37_9CORY|nr:MULTISPECIES: hypothetical protein [Corynebacterium]EFK53716.1 hypothetical protein HMPREF0291_11373 [Corynebacterium genitalium ATCC 33030]MCQ4621190.1 hypothetical protein [Corynebacterium sp. CCUG 71335]UUA88715.1 hypothetical protein KBP53_07245 [Corynebacterium genitalium ATCC 33030]